MSNKSHSQKFQIFSVHFDKFDVTKYHRKQGRSWGIKSWVEIFTFSDVNLVIWKSRGAIKPYGLKI